MIKTSASDAASVRRTRPWTARLHSCPLARVVATPLAPTPARSCQTPSRSPPQSSRFGRTVDAECEAAQGAADTGLPCPRLQCSHLLRNLAHRSEHATPREFGSGIRRSVRVKLRRHDDAKSCDTLACESIGAFEGCRNSRPRSRSSCRAGFLHDVQTSRALEVFLIPQTLRRFQRGPRAPWPTRPRTHDERGATVPRLAEAPTEYSLAFPVCTRDEENARRLNDRDEDCR